MHLRQVKLSGGPSTGSFRGCFEGGWGLNRNGGRTLSGLAVEFPLQRGNASFTKTVAASAQGLEMLFRRDCDQLNRMLFASDLNRALVTTPADQAVVELITKTLNSALEEFFFSDSGSHAFECMGQSRGGTDLVIRRHE